MLIGSGTSGAVVPYTGDGYAGVALDHGETQLLSNTNLGAVLDVIPDSQWSIGLGKGSVYDDGSGRVFARTDQIVDEAAAHPNGSVTFLVADPGRYGFTVGMAQLW